MASNGNINWAVSFACRLQFAHFQGTAVFGGQSPSPPLLLGSQQVFMFSKSYFETISKIGMGLGLSIVKKSAVSLGGDIQTIEGELGGAAFRVLLPAAYGIQANSHS